VPSDLPDFAQGGGVDVVAEYRSFHGAAPDAAADSLALLTWIRTFGLGEIPADHFVGPRDLYCEQRAGWGVFYTAGGAVSGRCDLMVLLVCNIQTEPFNNYVGEAQRRKAALGL
jgi:hypothetical protein